MSEKLDITPFREATARSGLSVAELAKLMGVDESRIRQLLGRSKTYTTKRLSDGTKKKYPQEYNHITYDTGVRWCRALGLDPVDLGV